MTRHWAHGVALTLMAAVTGAGCGGAEERSLILATTTSVQDAGLLDSLLPPFEREHGITVKVIAVGTGAALEMARRGDADVVMAHAADLEQQYVESGDLIEGRLVMTNDFVLVGPAVDPAGVRSSTSLDEALTAIARTGPFVSRGDGSGTEVRELALWAALGIEPAQVAGRVETGQGQGATLLLASERGAYALTDRSTYLALRPALKLEVLVEGDPRLLNEYRAYAVNPERHPGVAVEDARAFLAYLVSPAAQRFIGRFGTERFGDPLFRPAADG
ncbi:MAG TPA: substrate-binding domain-containing protein [Gemmatimonadales bacterium]|nr:substrate-binding domain-containing protein [Gemmatimonadales bacterium]